MEIKELGMGVLLLTPRVFYDDRGYYMESYSQRTLHEIGIDAVFVQDNHLLCLKKHTIRGIHFQNDPHAQAKLLRCTKGKILDIAVDLRRGSPTYRQYVSVELDAETKQQIFIPRGFGHVCMSLVDDTEVQYKVDELYYPEYDRAIAYNDPDIGIDWGDIDPIVSVKDRNAPRLCDSDVNFEWSGQ